jgi:hypothetical protein
MATFKLDQEDKIFNPSPREQNYIPETNPMATEPEGSTPPYTKIRY